MLRILRGRARSDRGSSELVPAIFLIPFILMFIFTIIDSALYMNNRSVVQAAARDGARSVAIMGGAGSATQGTPIELKYGIKRDAACSGLGSMPMVSQAYSGASTPIECNVMKGLAESKGLVNITVKKVSCSPQVTQAISARTSCAISWDYGSIPGSGLGLIQFSRGKGMSGENTSVGTAEAEVSLPAGALVTR